MRRALGANQRERKYKFAEDFPECTMERGLAALAFGVAG